MQEDDVVCAEHDRDDIRRVVLEDLRHARRVRVGEARCWKTAFAFVEEWSWQGRRVGVWILVGTIFGEESAGACECDVEG